jgi:hypothetical protein
MRFLNPVECVEGVKRADAARAREKAKREQDGNDFDGLSWDAFKARVKREHRERREAVEADNATIEAMSGTAKAEFFARRQTEGSVPMVGDGRPPRYRIAAEELEVEERKRAIAEREQREHDAGLRKAQAAHTARVEEIRRDRLVAEAEADEAKRAAREHEQEQLEELGPAPTLESLESVPA